PARYFPTRRSSDLRRRAGREGHGRDQAPAGARPAADDQRRRSIAAGKVDIAGHDGSVRVRSLESFVAKQKIPYYLGVSGKTSGAKGLSLNLIVVPPHASAEAHTHAEFESAVDVISGRAIHQWGDQLPFTLQTH